MSELSNISIYLFICVELVLNALKFSDLVGAVRLINIITLSHQILHFNSNSSYFLVCVCIYVY